MSSAGPNSGSTFTSDSSNGGSVAWTNPGNAAALDSSDTKAEYHAAAFLSHYLWATGFGFSIPGGNTIDGVVAEWARRISYGSIADDAVYLIKGGAVAGTNQSAGAAWTSGAYPYASFGGASSLWGTTLSVSDVNASNFGVAIAARGTTGGDPRVDHVRVTVYYSAAASGKLFRGSETRGLTGLGAGGPFFGNPIG